MKKVNIVTVLIVIILTLLLSACEANEDVMVPDGYLSVKQMQTDLNYIEKQFKRYHPLFNKGVPEGFAEALSNARDKLKEPISKEEFYFIANSVVTPLNDAHSAIYYKEDVIDYIDLPIKWYVDSAYIYKQSSLC